MYEKTNVDLLKQSHLRYCNSDLEVTFKIASALYRLFNRLKVKNWNIWVCNEIVTRYYLFWHAKEIKKNIIFQTVSKVLILVVFLAATALAMVAGTRMETKLIVLIFVIGISFYTVTQVVTQTKREEVYGFDVLEEAESNEQLER